ncbi:SDR family oxidoreductase [bacterium SCSIO 12696]|nr:SDR family oxidoreductase [bacterium SCSIO 12696]
MSKQLKLLLLGCGDIASRLAAKLPEQHYTVTGVRRTLPAQRPFTMLSADATHLDDMRDLLALGFDAVVITMTPSVRSEQGYRASYLKCVETFLQAAAVSGSRPMVIFVSSTSVYGQNSGQWVDETAATEPGSYSGQVLLAAEQRLQNSDLPNCIVRFSGIYGPGRQSQLRAARTGKPLTSPCGWTNRIHSEDCAGVLVHLLEKHRCGDRLSPLYTASDCQPVKQWQLRNFLNEQLGEPGLPAPTTSDAVTGKRCSNRQLLNSGYQFLHTGYRSGYRELIEQFEES